MTNHGSLVENISVGQQESLRNKEGLKGMARVWPIVVNVGFLMQSGSVGQKGSERVEVG